MHGMEMEKEDMASEVSPKDKAKVEMLHEQLMAIADKYDMGMEELIDQCCEEEPGMPEEDSAPEEESAPMDKAKIALIVGRMRGHKGE